MATKSSTTSRSTQTNLSDDFKKNVDKYSKQFTHIEKTVDQIRAKPGMYIGPLGKDGLKNMFRDLPKLNGPSIITNFSM